MHKIVIKSRVTLYHSWTGSQWLLRSRRVIMWSPYVQPRSMMAAIGECRGLSEKANWKNEKHYRDSVTPKVYHICNR